MTEYKCPDCGSHLHSATAADDHSYYCAACNIEWDWKDVQKAMLAKQGKGLVPLARVLEIVEGQRWLHECLSAGEYVGPEQLELEAILRLLREEFNQE